MQCKIYSKYDKYHKNLKYQQKRFLACIFITIIKYFVNSRSFCYSIVGPQVEYCKLVLLICWIFVIIPATLAFEFSDSRGYYSDINLQWLQSLKALKYLHTHQQF